MNHAPRFLSVDDVVALHGIGIADQGGDPHLRDRGLLESAVAVPAQQLGGEYLHADVPAMAAAYAFHICRNHPFVDGNKRAGAAAMIAFLSDNGWKFDAIADEAEPLFFQLAASELDKAAFTERARQYMREKPRIELRDFFRSIDPEKFVAAFLAVRPDAEGNTLQQFQATADEVATAMPLIHRLLEYNRVAVAANDENQRLGLGTTYMILTLCALYRVGESELGYEW